MTRTQAGYAAVDLGASGGRVMVARVGRSRLELAEAHRFANQPVRLPDGLHWDVLRLYQDVLHGLGNAARGGAAIVSVGVDSWGVDYGLLDRSGALLGNPYHYRDSRTDGVADKLHAVISRRDLYAITGVQVLPFNTVYQLAAARGTPQLEAARTLLLLPDLLGHWLAGGEPFAEATNASTTGLLDVRTGEWSPRVLRALGIGAELLPALRRPGEVVGRLRSELAAETGLPPSTVLTTVGSHDTASAVAGVPARGERFAYISCGTWSLVGVELEHPVLSEESRTANFTNERGVDGRVRYLRNVMGLWLLQESLRVWERAGLPADLPALLGAAALAAGGPVIDPDDPALLAPGDMPARIRAACRDRGQPEPAGQAELVRCILDSLAAAYARTLRDAERLSGRQVEVVHLVGGGARNRLLCELTAAACGLPVLAGPVEATALGNLLVQARAHGSVHGDLDTLRALVRATQEIRRHEPASAGRGRRGGGG
jgi:rhamnulokinase